MQSGIWERRRYASPVRLRAFRWRIVLPLALALVVAISAAVFVFPSTGAVTHADAVVFFDDGTGVRLGTAIGLIRAGAADTLVISYRPDRLQDCRSDLGATTVICFNPSPDNTRGEAQRIGAIARDHGWTSLIFVSDTPHLFRARILLERCFTGTLTAVKSSVTAIDWPIRVAYEWAATARTLTTSRSC